MESVGAAGERQGKNRPAGKSVGPQWHRDGKWNGEEGREQVAEGSFTASSRRRNEMRTLLSEDLGAGNVAEASTD
jgi:hypothetical protein